MNVIKRKLLDIATFFETSRSLEAIKDGFIRTLSLIFIGSIALVLSEFPVEAYQEFIHTDNMRWYLHVTKLVNSACMSWYSLFLSLSIADCYVKSIQKRMKNTDNMIIPFISGINFLVLSGITNNNYDSTYMGTSGMFIAILSSILTCKIYLFVAEKISIGEKRWIQGIDAKMAGIILSIIPSVVVIFISAVINVFLYEIMQCSLQQLVSKLLVEFFLSLNIGKLFKGALYIITIQSLWFCGIHGNNVLFKINDGYYADMLIANINALNWGHEPREIVNITFFNVFINIGGSGATLGLLLVLLFTNCRKTLKYIARVGIIPSIFNINEILTFGLPIVLNPILIIPFFLAPLTNYFITYSAIASGVVPIVCKEVNWTIPVFLSGYEATGSTSGIILQVILLILDCMIYYPFVKLLDIQRNRSFHHAVLEVVEYIKQCEKQLERPKLLDGSNRIGITSRILLNDLEIAIKNKDLNMFYQPQFTVSGECIGAEALLRWKHPLEGMMYPPLVIALAKEGGILYRLEEVIFEMVCEEMEKTRKKNKQDFKISVNITNESLFNPDFEEVLERCVRTHGIDHKNLWIEITEQDALSSSMDVINLLNRLKEKGHKLLIDDFGMGYTSINYLQTNLFDVVKLDGNITKDIMNNPRNKEIVLSIVYLSKSLGFQIVAEYVETEEQRDCLAEIGCHVFQGYLYSKPVPYYEFESMLKEK